jgi:hypothetical protein
VERNHIPNLFQYILLISRPEARNIYQRAQETKSEISGLSLWMVYSLEFVIRIGIFVFIAATIESILTDTIFETFKIDILLLSIFAMSSLQTLSCALYFDSDMQGTQKPFLYLHHFFYCVIASYFPIPVLIRLQQLYPHVFSIELIKIIVIATFIIFTLISLSYSWFSIKKYQL